MVTHLFVLQHWMTTLESRSEIKNEFVLMISWYMYIGRQFYHTVCAVLLSI